MISLRKILVFTCLCLVFKYGHFASLPQSSTPEKILSFESLSENKVQHTFVLLGASGDLSKREIYPALWYLYRDNLLPPKTRILGSARRNFTVEQIRKQVEPFVEVSPEDQKLYEKFWLLNSYISASQNSDYDKLNAVIDRYEDGKPGNRLFYLALPPAVFPATAAQIKRACMAKRGWTRIVVEKPFGRDSDSSAKLDVELLSLFTEDQLYRMDHFLSYEMVQNLLALRFANRMFQPAWNRDNIASIEIDFKENFGVEGRGGYFDSNGIIRDVMQNHLLQILSLVAMEQPVSNNPNDIRDAKVSLLRKTKNIDIGDVVIGQYVANPESKDPRERMGYRDDPTVSKDSLASTFALTVLKIENERWNGVPFIIRAGKGLNINQTDIIIQFKDVQSDVFSNGAKRNELIIRVGKSQELIAKLMSKTPGFSSNIEQIAIDYNYDNNYNMSAMPNGYEKLILDVFRGSQMNFVRSDELVEAWRIFTPILHEIEDKNIQPIEYKFGSTGPIEADDLEKKYNFL